MRLAACNAEARVSGLRIGQALAEALALIPALNVAEINREANHAMLLKLAAACERFTPLVALDGLDGLLLDVTGCAHLHDGEAGLQNAIAMFVASKGFTLRQALAGSFECAHVVARFGRKVLIKPGQELEAVADLGVTALECESSITTALTRAGLKTIGDLEARPSQLLMARFGASLTTKLARVLAREDMRLSPLRPQGALTADASFAEPIRNIDHVMLALSRLITQLCDDMEKRGVGGRAFEASFFRADGDTRKLAISTATPMRDGTGISKLFALRLDTLNDPLETGYGFDCLRLCVLRAESLRQTQTCIDQKQEETNAEADLINRLCIRFSPTRVLGFVAGDSHDPSRAAVLLPITKAKASPPFRLDDNAMPRPLHMFDPPQLIDVMAEVPDGPPIRFRWRKMLHQVRAAEGPERIEGEWWHGAKRVRDYYRVEDSEGARFWVFRDGLFTDQTPRWFMQGLFA